MPSLFGDSSGRHDHEVLLHNKDTRRRNAQPGDGIYDNLQAEEKLVRSHPPQLALSSGGQGVEPGEGYDIRTQHSPYTNGLPQYGQVFQSSCDTRPQFGQVDTAGLVGDNGVD